MEEALRFFRAFEVWIYLLLGLTGVIFIRRFALAWQELRGAAFGLERENAQSRLNQSAGILVLLLSMAVTEFILVSFIAPSVPGAIPLLTPTVSLLTTPTTTLPAGALEGTGAPASQAPGTPGPIADNGCVAGQVSIGSPSAGQEINGVYEITGTVKIENFGFYILKMRRPGEANWSTLEAGNQVKINALLGRWDTRRLTPGDYQLGLMVSDNQNKSLPPCIVQVRVIKTEETTPTP